MLWHQMTLYIACIAVVEYICGPTCIHRKERLHVIMITAFVPVKVYDVRTNKIRKFMHSVYHCSSTNLYHQ